MMTSLLTASPPDVRGIVAPLLPSLPGAAVATEPAPAVLPLLSPILRQRVQLLSSSSTDPWMRLLSYDPAKAAKLVEQLKDNDRFEPHPISGEIEIDWELDAETKYRRLDQETLQALVVLDGFDLFFRLVYCTNDPAGGGDGWRIGEVSVPDKPSPFGSFGGKVNIAEANREFEEGQVAKQQLARTGAGVGVSARMNGVSLRLGDTVIPDAEADDEDDDDNYWARYDASPARTPAANRSPAPALARSPQQNAYGKHVATTTNANTAEDDEYYAQYDSVQPAMDNHDPDEAAHIETITVTPPPPLGLVRPSVAAKGEGGDVEANETNGVWTLAGGSEGDQSGGLGSRQSDWDAERQERLLHPRPASSAASSSGASIVSRLEENAEKREQGELGVKQHVSRSIKSLFLLSKASGIDREEFERLVKTELDLLALIED